MRTSRTLLKMFVAISSVIWCLSAQLAVAESPDQSSWAVMVDQVSPGDTDIDPAFQAAIYEHLIDELQKTKRFDRVFREGDRKASEAAHLLVLKTIVAAYKRGSETRRAVTTISGFTKLRVDSQLCTRDGQVISQWKVDGNVRFVGGNLRATQTVARHIAAKLKHATLPSAQEPAPREQAVAGQ